ncbi:MAG: hypothetical protein RR838_04840 [Clostridium sp.]
MSCRFIYLAFENLKRSFFKIRFLGTVIGLAFIIAYSGASFSIYGGSYKEAYTSNDFIIYFLNDYTVTGIFLVVLFTIYLSSVFSDGEINYMYISRLKKKSDLFKSYILSIFLFACVFLVITLIGVFIVGGVLSKYHNNWSEFAGVIIKENGYGLLSSVYTPWTSIVISIWLLFMMLIIVGLIFYLGYCISKEIGLPILIQSIIIIVSGIVYSFKIDILYTFIS